MNATTIGDRAVILGGSLAALLAARVLSEHYRQVVLVDRDELLGVSGPRRGAPHGRHAHGLVARGQQIFEQLVPGITDDLIRAGVRPGDFNGDIQWFFGGRRLRPSTSGLLSVPATRPVLEHLLRERIAALPNVEFRQCHDILHLHTSTDGDVVLGAVIQSQEPGSRPYQLDGDLVVDITGRGSRTPVWLESLGYERPAEDRVKIDLAYTTQHFRLADDPFGKDLALIPAATPSHPRGAFFYRLPGDGNRVELSLTGVLGDHPPTDQDGFLAFTRSLPIPEIYRAVHDAEPLDTPVRFKYPASFRRRYERMTRFPANFLVLGDAVCSFNPIYAQGMTLAAMEAQILDRLLAQGHTPHWRPYFRDVGRAVDSAWSFSAGADLGYPGVPGRRPVQLRMINAYVARFQQAAVHDAGLTNAFIRVAGLVSPPASLLRPDRAARVLAHTLLGRTASPPPSAALGAPAGATPVTTTSKGE